LKSLKWHRIYISSLFTYELPRTVRTVKYYQQSVNDPNNLIVGGIGATLMPDYISERVACRIIAGPLDKRRIIGKESKPIGKLPPDYGLLDGSRWHYCPEDSYFCRATIGCIRRCKFCAVRTLEPRFKYFQSVRTQIRDVNEAYGEKHNLVMLDNNILACDDLEKIVCDIKNAGFEAGAVKNNRKRNVDFNQGIDARLITRNNSKVLSSIALSPIRLAFDYRGIEQAYTKAIRLLAGRGFDKYTNYVMFNYNDSPRDFYYRIRVNTTLSGKMGIRITSFPMKYVPINDVSRGYIAPKWKWRYLRGIQCVLLATHGMVSPSREFVEAAFGSTYREFLEIISMPDRYIMFRKKYEANGCVTAWRRSFNRMLPDSKREFLALLQVLNKTRNKMEIINRNKRFRKLLEHYYPGGEPVVCE